MVAWRSLSYSGWWGGGVAIALSVPGSIAIAQVIPDATLPLNSQVIPGCTICPIEGGTVRGSNLFHSFTQFSIPTGGQALFNNPASIQTILARVTGNNLSTIDGLIQANGTANLFILNPNGIVFGQNARLQIGGSFVASTANAIQFGNQGFFSATNPESPGLLTISPSAFWFNQLPTQPIINRAIGGGGLQVLQGRNLLLIGGEVHLEGGIIRAPNGRVELGGSRSTGQVGLNSNGNQWQLIFLEGLARSDVTLSSNAQINVQGNGSGNVAITANDFILSGVNSGVLGGIVTGLNAVDVEPGAINIAATNAIRLDQGRISNQVVSGARGNSGPITLNTGSLFMTNGSVVSTSLFGQGNAGDIAVEARDAIVISGVSANELVSSLISSGVGRGATGSGGNISIRGKTLSVTNGGLISTATQSLGDAGDLKITVDDLIVFDGVTSGRFPQISGITSFVQDIAVGNGGNISLTTKSLYISNGASLNASAVGTGNAGKILIDASTVEVSGESRGFLSSIVSVIENLDVPGVLQNAGGVGGTITINTNLLKMSGGGNISTQIFRAPGKAGDIIINANAVNVSGLSPISTSASNRGSLSTRGSSSGIYTSTVGVNAGNGGLIQINSRRVNVTDGALISARSLSQSAAGDLLLNIESLAISNGGQLISTADFGGSAGKITINATESVLVAGRDTSFSQRSQTSPIAISRSPVSPNSGIFVRSSGSGAAGDITINSPRIQLDQQGRLIAESATGSGGNITLDVRDLLLLRRGSVISTTAGTAQSGGDGGNLFINTKFVVADRTENSDVTANAFTGRGGNVRISASDIYGLEFRPGLTPFSDITASSTFGISGTVVLDTPDLDPNRGLQELPVDLADASNLINQTACRVTDSSEFVITGRSGVPDSPDRTLNADSSWEDWRVEAEGRRLEAPREQESKGAREQGKQSTPQHSPSIVEAQGWKRDENGNVRLVAAEQPLSGGWWAVPNCQSVKSGG